MVYLRYQIWGLPVKRKRVTNDTHEILDINQLKKMSNGERLCEPFYLIKSG